MLEPEDVKKDIFNSIQRIQNLMSIDPTNEKIIRPEKFKNLDLNQSSAANLHMTNSSRELLKPI